MKRKLHCVLLVDDNDADNFIHRRVILKAGIADYIEIAEHGREALNLLVEKGKCGNPGSPDVRPDLIFLDINMPVMNGWEFLEEYQKLFEIQKDKPVIILTSSSNPADIAKAEKLLGVGSILFKPLTLKMLDELMHSHFPEYL